ncbi:MAG: DUF4325 domain-containing protein [Candidatus Omnitrophica bacterium]|nr:DUF4325 domain-containing protein [Candidatus Omnitrophota bacterium]
MDIKQIILDEIEAKGFVKTSEIVARTKFSRAYINRFFKALKDEGRIVLIGKANAARYMKPRMGAIAASGTGRAAHLMLRNVSIEEDAVLERVKHIPALLDGLKPNVSSIFGYAFTEILNNAIEHSSSRMIDVRVYREEGTVSFEVADTGVGIFNRIREMKGLSTDMEAVQDLLKGKLTTAPAAHSGEGIFFTSKSADRMVIQSAFKKIVFYNTAADLFVKDMTKYRRGTRVKFTVREDTDRTMSEVFRKYTDGSFDFSATGVKVALYAEGAEYLSRSQARRILSGLEKFRRVELDFAGVDTVGQGFADEIFRVWQNHHPDTEIVPLNASQNSMFMIDRARGKHD